MASQKLSLSLFLYYHDYHIVSLFVLLHFRFGFVLVFIQIFCFVWKIWNCENSWNFGTKYVCSPNNRLISLAKLIDELS